MKIKGYKLFLENKQSKEEIDSICQKYDIKNYTINEDGTVDVNGDVNLSFNKLTKIPLKFGRVTGRFNCSDNRFTSLEGCPNWVGGNFTCNYNKLTTLEGGPNIVCGSDYRCASNALINFKGIPEHYEGDIWFSDNPVSKLIENIPIEKWNKFIYWCNEYDAIDNEGNIIPERMEEVHHKIGLEYEKS